MPTVWMREHPKHRTRFHRHPDCYQLTKPPSRGEPHPLIAVDLEDVTARPCAKCYPDAPRIKVRRAWCYTCESRYACQHNGGVLIIDRAGRRYWVWPDTNSMPLYRQRLV